VQPAEPGNSQGLRGSCWRRPPPRPALLPAPAPGRAPARLLCFPPAHGTLLLCAETRRGRVSPHGAASGSVRPRSDLRACQRERGFTVGTACSERPPPDPSARLPGGFSPLRRTLCSQSTDRNSSKRRLSGR